MRFTFFVVLCTFSSCVLYEEVSFGVAIELKFYNFLESGSTTISALGLIFGEEEKVNNYPFDVPFNGGCYSTVIKSNAEELIAGFLVIVVQNGEMIKINFNNGKAFRFVEMGKNRIWNEGSIRVKTDVFYFYFRTVASRNKYSIMIALSG